MKRTLYTIGYEGVTVDALIRTLSDAGIETLLDVRAVPLSRKPGFSKNKLAARLRESGMNYTGLKGLGTPAEGREAARKGRIADLQAIFGAHLGTPAAIRDMDEAVLLSQRTRCCLLCFEHSPAECHRLIVADKMAERTGQDIIHLNPALPELL